MRDASVIALMIFAEPTNRASVATGGDYRPRRRVPQRATVEKPESKTTEQREHGRRL